MKKKNPPKSAIACIQADTTSYQERSDLAKRETVAALMQRGIGRYQYGKEQAIECGRAAVRSVNALIEAGADFNDAEKVSQHEFKAFTATLDGWARDYERSQKIKAAQKIHRLLDGRKVSTLEAAAPVLHQVWLLSGQAQELRRLGNEMSHEPLNPFNALITTAATVELWLKKWEPAEKPVESYYAAQSVETLEKIEMAIRPMAVRYALIQGLLKQKVACA